MLAQKTANDAARAQDKDSAADASEKGHSVHVLTVRPVPERRNIADSLRSGITVEDNFYVFAAEA